MFNACERQRIMEDKVKKTHVFVINGTQMVVADTMDEAIGIYRLANADSEVRKVEQVCFGDKYSQESYDALY